MNLTLQMAIGVMVMLGAFCGLAIAGIGGMDAFLAHPPLVIVALVTFLAGVVALFTKGNLSSGETEDKGNRWVLAFFFLMAPLLAYAPAFTDRIDFWTIDGETTRWIGVVLFILGAVLRMWPVFVLGNRFSGLVAIQKEHDLVTDGIYNYIRHPSYLGLLVNMLGWALAFRSGVGVLLTVATVPVILGRISAEEKLLAAHFGTAYDAFRAHTKWRLIPGIF
jgi:protein-S-isoprenylcysteine O-methyltransferase Ste14